MSTLSIRRRIEHKVLLDIVIAAEVAAISFLTHENRAATSPLYRKGDPLLNLDFKDPTSFRKTDKFDESLLDSLIREDDTKDFSGQTKIDGYSFGEFNKLIDQYTTLKYSKDILKPLKNLKDEDRKKIYALLKSRRDIYQLRYNLSNPDYLKSLRKQASQTDSSQGDISFFGILKNTYVELDTKISEYNKTLHQLSMQGIHFPVDVDKNAIAYAIAYKEFQTESDKLKGYTDAISSNKDINVNTNDALIKAVQDNNASLLIDYKAAKLFIESEVSKQQLNIPVINLTDFPNNIKDSIQTYQSLSTLSLNSNSLQQDQLLETANKLEEVIITRYSIPRETSLELIQESFDEINEFKQKGDQDSFDSLAIVLLKEAYINANYSDDFEDKLSHDLKELFNLYVDAGVFQADNDDNEDDSIDDVRKETIENTIRDFIKDKYLKTNNNKEAIEQLKLDGSRQRHAIIQKFAVDNSHKQEFVKIFELINRDKNYYDNPVATLFDHLASDLLVRLKPRNTNDSQVVGPKIKELSYNIFEYSKLSQKFHQLKDSDNQKILDERLVNEKSEEFMAALHSNSLEESLKVLNKDALEKEFIPITFKSHYPDLDFTLDSKEDVEHKLEDINDFLNDNNEEFHKFIKDKGYQHEIVENQKLIVKDLQDNLQYIDLQNVFTEVKLSKDELDKARYINAVYADKVTKDAMSIRNVLPSVEIIKPTIPSGDLTVAQDIKNGTFNGAFKYSTYLLNYNPGHLTEHEEDLGLFQKDKGEYINSTIGRTLSDKVNTLEINYKAFSDSFSTMKMPGFDSEEEYKKKLGNYVLLTNSAANSRIVLKNTLIDDIPITLPGPQDFGADAVVAFGLLNGLIIDNLKDTYDNPYFQVRSYDYLTSEYINMANGVKPKPEEQTARVIASYLNQDYSLHTLLAAEEFIDSNGYPLRVGDPVEAIFASGLRGQFKVNTILNGILHLDETGSKRAPKITQDDVNKGITIIKLSEAEKVFDKTRIPVRDPIQQTKEDKQEKETNNITPEMLNELKELGYPPHETAFMDYDEASLIIKNKVNYIKEETPKPKMESLKILSADDISKLQNLGWSSIQIESMNYDAAQETIKNGTKTFTPTFNIRSILKGLGWLDEDIDKMTLDVQNDYVMRSIKKSTVIGDMTFDDNGELRDKELGLRVKIISNYIPKEDVKLLINKNQAIDALRYLEKISKELKEDHAKLIKQEEDYNKNREDLKKDAEDKYNKAKNNLILFNKVTTDLNNNKVPELTELVKLDIIEPNIIKDKLKAHATNLELVTFYKNRLQIKALAIYKQELLAKKRLFPAYTHKRELDQLNVNIHHFHREETNILHTFHERKKQHEIDKFMGNEPSQLEKLNLKTVHDFSDNPIKPRIADEPIHLDTLNNLNKPDQNPDVKLHETIVRSEEHPLPSLDEFEQLNPSTKETLPPNDVEEDIDDIFNPENLFRDKVLEIKDEPEDVENDENNDEEDTEDNEEEDKESNLKVEDFMPIDEFIHDNH